MMKNVLYLTGEEENRMFKKKDNCTSIQEIVERNTGMKIEKFLESQKNPYIKNLKEAVALLLQHKQEPIHIIGDFDVDGISATLIMMYGLFMAGLSFQYRLPHRFSEGYGLSEKIIDEIQSGVVITVDNGISAHKAIKKAKEKGLTVIVTDHHQAVTQEDEILLPEADIIVNPSIEEESEFHSLCGAGIAYYFVKQLLGKDVIELLVMAAIATVADVVPLIGPNRALVKQGIEALNQGYGVPGLLSLLQVMNKEIINEDDFGFCIGPILNATGRLLDNGSEKTLSFLLMSSTNPKLEEVTQKFIDMNGCRKMITKKAIQQAEEDYKGDRPIVIYNPNLGEGIIGLVAGQFSEKYQCPVICFTKTKHGFLKGSGRSIPEIHLKNTLDKMQNLIVSYGGHAGAAGLSIKEENLDEFIKAFTQACGTIPPLCKDTFYDLSITEDELPNVMEQLKLYAPYGEGNNKILFHIRCNFKQNNFRKIGDGTHILHYSPSLKIIGYGKSAQFDALVEKYGFPEQLNCVGYLSESWFQNKCTYQLELVDFER